MAITHYRGPIDIEFYPKTASTAFAEGDLVYLSSGYLARFTATTDQPPLGRIMKAIASTDSDYASATMVPVQTPASPNTEYLCDIGNGTGAQSYVGTWIDVDDTYPYTKVDCDTGNYDHFFITKHVSTTQLVARIATSDPRPDSIVD